MKDFRVNDKTTNSPVSYVFSCDFCVQIDFMFDFTHVYPNEQEKTCWAFLL